MSEILSRYKDGVRTIIINRPRKKNAIHRGMYVAIKNILNEDIMNDDVVVTIITGTGDYFSSGNDVMMAIEDNELSGDQKLNIVKDMVNAFINYPKLLIAVVNGPAIGIGATITGVCDIIYATENAVFDAPFIKLGLCAEAASSFTLPYNLGRSKASEVLYLNHKLSAHEAYEFGLISKVIPKDKIDQFIEDLHKYGKLPLKTLIWNKKLVMANFRNILLECNNREMEQLNECSHSDEFSNALIKFMSKL